MAGSRVEKFSNIFKRYTGLIDAGAVLKENRPIWYDIYEAFPPTTNPLAIRKTPDIEIKNIFYAEDVKRARSQEESSQARKGLVRKNILSKKLNGDKLNQELTKN